MKKEKKSYALKATALLNIFRCYTELLRLYHTHNALQKHHALTAHKIQDFLRNTYQEIIEDYLRRCDNMESSMVNIILDAIGEYAFSEHWFIEGMEKLYRLKKQFKILPRKSEFNFTESYSQVCKMEKKFKKYSTRDVFGWDAGDDEEETKKTKSKKRGLYYKTFLKNMAIAHIHYCYGLLRDDLHKHILEDIPPMKLDEFNKLIKNINQKILPDKT